MKQYTSATFTADWDVAVWDAINNHIAGCKKISGLEYRVHTATRRKLNLRTWWWYARRRRRPHVSYDVLFEYEETD